MNRPDNCLEEIDKLDLRTDLPKRLWLISQRFDDSCIGDVAHATNEALQRSGLHEKIPAEASVAVGVGSRGITGISVIIREVIKVFRKANMRPFVFPAMGSHGNATAEGQISILEMLGITEEFIRAEIRACMDAVEIGHIPGGPVLYQDANAAAADFTFLVNRVKPHTDFHNSLESGLAKMAVIGMGKRRGAQQFHSRGALGFQSYLKPAARIYETNTNLVGGLAILENAYKQVSDIVVLSASEIGAAREEQLLARSRELMGTLPFSAIDVLVVRRIGKDISGTGMDTNVIGRIGIPRQQEILREPNIATIAALDLTEKSHGNAAGIGLANVVTKRLAQKIRWTDTYTNAITSGVFGMQRVSLPITMSSDKKAVQVALLGCGIPSVQRRIVFMEDTLNLTKLWVNEPLLVEVQDDVNLTIEDVVDLSFDESGNMISPWSL